MPGLFPFFTHLGLEAVGVFFVMSGFVIAYVADGRENDGQIYTISRLSRLYSVVIPCLGVTLMLDATGTHFLPHYYQMSWPPLPNLEKRIFDVLFSLTFLNSVWHVRVVPGSDAPFWSLSFEAPYYLLFGLVYFLKGKWRWITAGSVGMALGPHIMALFPLWLLGVGCYRTCKSIEITPLFARRLFFAAFTAWGLCELVRWKYGIGMVTPGGSLRYDWQFYAAGIPFAASIVGLWFSSFGDIKFERFIRWLSGATFTLYLLHFPLARFLNGFVPAGMPPMARWLILLVLTVASALAFAEITERRKNQWRTLIERIWMLISRFCGLPGASGLPIATTPVGQAPSPHTEHAV